MLVSVLDYNDQVGPAALNVPDLPKGFFGHGAVDLLEDGVWLSGWDRDVYDEDKKCLVYQLVGGEWVRVTCEKTLTWFDKKSPEGEIEYRV